MARQVVLRSCGRPSALGKTKSHLLGGHWSFHFLSAKQSSSEMWIFRIECFVLGVENTGSPSRYSPDQFRRMVISLCSKSMSRHIKANASPCRTPVNGNVVKMV